MTDIVIFALIVGAIVVGALIVRKGGPSRTAMPGGEVSPLAAWWFASIPAFERAEDLVVRLGGSLRRWDKGTASKDQLDEAWARAEHAIAECVEALSRRPPAGADAYLVDPLFATYTDAVDHFRVAANAWWSSDLGRMDIAWDRAVELFDQATDRAKVMAKVTRR